MHTFTFTTVGNSIAVTIPKALADRMGIHKGDKGAMTFDPAEGLRITTVDPDFEKSMQAVGRVMSKYKNALHELAKR